MVALVSLLLSAGYVLPAPPLAAALRRGIGPTMQVEAPPRPPPPTAVDRGEGGGGDSDEYLRLLNPAEQAELIEDWTARSRVYRMSNDDEVVGQHTTALETLAQMAMWDEGNKAAQAAGVDAPKRVALGLFAPGQVCALATAELSQDTGLVVHGLVVNPGELSVRDSTAALRLLHGLRSLAEAISVPLTAGPLKEVNGGRYWLAHSLLHRDDGEGDWPECEGLGCPTE